VEVAGHLQLARSYPLPWTMLAAKPGGLGRPRRPVRGVSAGLAALDGSLHGAASGQVHRLLSDAIRSGDPVGTVAERLRTGGAVPGFGHRLSPDGDPRAAVLLAALGPGSGRSAETIAAVADAVTSRSGAAPNIDFALATLTVRHGLPADAGEAIFAVARTAGWIAHALEEYADRGGRFRPSGRPE